MDDSEQKYSVVYSPEIISFQKPISKKYGTFKQF